MQPPYGVHDYIEKCQTDNLYNGILSDKMGDDQENLNRGCRGIESRPVGWRKRRVHTGDAPLTCIEVQLCDQIWVRCLEEVQHQSRVITLLNMMHNMDRGWERFDYIPGIFPIPIPEW